MATLVPNYLRWFEPLFVRVLRHEYATSMRFDSDTAYEPVPPAEPCELYVHVPFCEVLCPFCSFHRVRFREGKAAAYFRALNNEIRYYHDRGFRFSSVYVGGGTPTVAPDALIETLSLIRTLWPVQAIAVETNPNHVREPLLSKLVDAGVSRLSVGVQSFDDRLLRQMERYDKYGSGAQICERLNEARGRFRTLNVDMIFDFPNQTLADLDRDLATLLQLEVDQVSFYPLMTAPTARRRMEQTLGQRRADHRYQFYERILERMLPVYEPSSAWCFSRARKGESRAIDEYIVDARDYVGIGSGAFSLVNGAMYSTTFSINQYIQRISQGHSGITQSKQLRLKERMRYDYLVRLFGLTLSKDEIRRRYGNGFGWRMFPELALMRLVGATRHGPDAIRLTPRGMYYWVVMMAEFFTAVNAFRDQMRLHIREELLDDERIAAVVPLTQLIRKSAGG